MRKFFASMAFALSLALALEAWPAADGLMKVNINSDDAAAIAEVLDGVGLTKAAAIVAYREANGPFADASELIKVKGIGERTVSINMERIEVESAP